MPGSFFIDWALRTGVPPSHLEAMMEDEPEWWKNRFWIYVRGKSINERELVASMLD